MKRDAHLRWEAQGGGHFPLGKAVLRVNHPALGDVEVPVYVEDSNGRGSVATTNIGSDGRIVRITSHWINLPLIRPASRLGTQDRFWRGRWTVDVHPWSLTLDARFDLAETIRELSAIDEQFAMTHVGELTRTDGSAFDVAEGHDVLFGWQFAMSFALGRWVAPALPVGFDENGQRACEQWAAWRCDGMRGYESWWDTHTGDDLAEFVRAFLEAYLTPAERPIVRHVAHHVIAANHSGTPGEAKIMLALAGLEYLAWVDLVLSKRLTRKKFKALPADARIRELLTSAGIPSEVPVELEQVGQLASTRNLDGPGSAMWLRNRLVHPKDPEEPYRIKGLVWQTSQLLLEYAELLLLARLRYDGRFNRRYPPGRWAHASEPVPWTPPQPTDG